jgi:hypothetical protein
MMRSVALVATVALAASPSCEFAQKHPAVAAGIAGGTVGFVGCVTDSVDMSTCAIVGGSAALFLGGIAALATLLFETNDTQPVPEDEEEEMTRSGAIKVHTHTAPPPVVIDAGVAPVPVVPPPVIDAAPAPPVDAPSTPPPP